MPRLTAPNGVIVSVSDETAKRLLTAGYRPAPDPVAHAVPDLTPKRPAKQAVRKQPTGED